MDQQPPLRIVSGSEPKKFMRLPAPGNRDPLFGFSRSYLNSLVLPSMENDFNPPVVSFVLRKNRKSRCGVRLIDVASLEAYIVKQPQEKGKPPIGG